MRGSIPPRVVAPTVGACTTMDQGNPLPEDERQSDATVTGTEIRRYVLDRETSDQLRRDIYRAVHEADERHPNGAPVGEVVERAIAARPKNSLGDVLPILWLMLNVGDVYSPSPTRVRGISDELLEDDGDGA